MKIIPILLNTVILFSIQQTASAQTKGAIAIEDCVAFETTTFGNAPSKKSLQIKAGEIFSFDKGTSTTAGAQQTTVLSAKVDGLLQAMYFSDPAGVSKPAIVWVPEKSVQLFTATTVRSPSELYSPPGFGMKHKWKDSFVAEAKKAAPEAVRAKMGWADPFIARIEERQ